MSSHEPTYGADFLEKYRRFRVFISYSRDDRAVADQVVRMLRENGLMPVWDRNFAYGHGFHDQIKSFIAHAHVFLPLITESSSQRGWVHQEIGYALALNVPVLPVCYHPGPQSPTEPGQMLQHLQAVYLSDPVEEQQHLFTPTVFTNLLSRLEDPSLAYYRCSEVAEERAAMMAEYAQEAQFAQEALELVDTGHVWQRGALSSFHIPDKVISDPVWKKRYERPKAKTPTAASKGDGTPAKEPTYEEPTEYHCKLQRKERLALTKHAERSGCSLIINPHLEFSRITCRARIVRLNCLVEFLQSMEKLPVPVRVAINPQMEDEKNTTIVGNWFAAESVSMVGPRQTNFTTHAPSIQTRIELFERELLDLLKQSNIDPADSRARAIREIQGIIASLEKRKDNKMKRDIEDSEIRRDIAGTPDESGDAETL